MKNLSILILVSIQIFIQSCGSSSEPVSLSPEPGRLRVGFDIDDTVVFSRETFLKAAQRDSAELDYAWVNSNDKNYSIMIPEIQELIQFYRAHGHKVFFITARPGVNGEHLADYLSQELNMIVKKDVNLFFSPKERHAETGKRFTTKHHRMRSLGLHLFFGDSDTDIIAASIAGVRAVRVVRHPSSIAAYSRNYFGDTRSEKVAASPFQAAEYDAFLNANVGPFGETIYPIRSLSSLTLPEE